MIITTTPSIEGRQITAYLGVCSGEAVVGANIFRDLFASVRDIVGGRSGSYEKVLAGARQMALDHLEGVKPASLAPQPSSASASTTKCWATRARC